MKKLMLSIMVLAITQLSGCDITSNFSPIDSNVKFVEDKEGRVVLDCFEKTIPYRTNRAKDFWKENNLPNGTTEFICKDGKAYLPNQVTDCQGNVIANQNGGLQGFKQRNGLPLTYDNIRFICQNGKAVQWYK